MIADDVWPGDEVRTDHGEGDLSHREQTTDADLEKLQHESFNYFLHEANAANGLVRSTGGS